MGKAYTIWFTGLHGSGKSTIANALMEILRKNSIKTELLDGDELRKTISSGLGYSLEERNEHMKRVADLCKKITDKGTMAIASVASPTEKSRDYARKILKKILLVYVKCPLEICAKRDVKGHYKKAGKNEEGFEHFMKVSSKFEEPKNADIVLNTNKETIGESVSRLVQKLREKGLM